MNNTIPNADKIHQIVSACSFDPENDVTIDVKLVDGVIRDFSFDPKRLEEHKEEILTQIAGLPEQFSLGWSFLQACMNKDGEQWGEHENVEELMVLGIAIGKIELSLPRELWSMLPGGVPYFQVK